MSSQRNDKHSSFLFGTSKSQVSDVFHSNHDSRTDLIKSLAVEWADRTKENDSDVRQLSYSRPWNVVTNLHNDDYVNARMSDDLHEHRRLWSDMNEPVWHDVDVKVMNEEDDKTRLRSRSQFVQRKEGKLISDYFPRENFKHSCHESNLKFSTHKHEPELLFKEGYRDKIPAINPELRSAAPSPSKTSEELDQQKQSYSRDTRSIPAKWYDETQLITTKARPLPSVRMQPSEVSRRFHRSVNDHRGLRDAQLEDEWMDGGHVLVTEQPYLTREHHLKQPVRAKEWMPDCRTGALCYESSSRKRQGTSENYDCIRQPNEDRRECSSLPTSKVVTTASTSTCIEKTEEERKVGEPSIVQPITSTDTTKIKGNTSSRIKLREFNATEEVEVFVKRFRLCQIENRWGPDSSYNHLCCALSGSAAQLLFEESTDGTKDVEALLAKLLDRYGNQHQRLLFQIQLQSKRQGENETLQELVSDIRRLSDLAYPGGKNPHTHFVIVKAYIDSLRSRSVAMKILESDPSDLEACHRLALKLTAYQAIAATEDSATMKPPLKVKTIRTSENETEQTISRLEKRIRQLEASQTYPAGNKQNWASQVNNSSQRWVGRIDNR